METRRRLRKRVKFCSWMKVYALPTRTTKKKKKKQGDIIRKILNERTYTENFSKKSGNCKCYIIRVGDGIFNQPVKTKTMDERPS